MTRTKTAQDALQNIRDTVGAVVVGSDDVVTHLLVAILCDGHALLESVPGLGKTTIIKSLAQSMRLSFSRIQNTPDLLPSDILGTQIINQSGGKTSFTFQKGPIFANIVLADEINRATPKTQAALLEAMQEKQVTTFGQSMQLDDPFFVLATQNPIDQEGTYPLPEAQTDRFLLKIFVDYPSMEEEERIIDIYASDEHDIPEVKPVLSRDNLLDLQDLAAQVPISKELTKAALTLVRATREDKKYITVGASPRASIGLVKAARALALINGRAHVTKEDIISMAKPVLRHRIMLSFEAERENKSADQIIDELCAKHIRR